MEKFFETALGQIVARNGILAVILAFSLWSNHILVERLFGLIQDQVTVSTKVLAVLEELRNRAPKGTAVQWKP